MYLLGLMIVFGLLGVFALQNGGSQNFTFLGYLWHLPTWVPVGSVSTSVADVAGAAPELLNVMV